MQEIICNSVKIRLISVERNKHFPQCRTCNPYKGEWQRCPWIENDGRNLYNRSPQNAQCVISTMVEFEIINCSQKNEANLDYALIDTTAHEYSPNDSICSEITDHYDGKYSYYPPMTISRARLYFPELPQDVFVSKLIISIEEDDVEFVLAPYDPKTIAMFEMNETDDLACIRKNKLTEEKIDGMFMRAENQEHILFRTKHDQKEENELIKEIEFLFAAIKSEIPKLFTESQTSYLEQYAARMRTYKTQIMILDEERKQSHRFYEHAERLNDLSPREFEMWCAEFFSILGYSTNVTPFIADGGIDIYLEKKSTIYGVQCKKYKSSVFAPDIQKFIGALVSHGLSYGIFITTGIFSIGAIELCKNNHIELYDKYRIAETLREISSTPPNIGS